MDGFKAGKLLRIFVDENDRHGSQPMYTAIVEFLRSRHIAGATVFRGIEGYGRHQEVHIAKIFSWLPNLPVLIEVVDDAEKIERILVDIEAFVDEGLATIENVEYLRLGKDKASSEGENPV
ncbi:MAG: DUF190 domain-containing protein [Candidatus Eremiobacteraeota bacterium]|nr:DUF190 domain-containing protein [Candidatus Eremiobacteraeota bacterium]